MFDIKEYYSNEYLYNTIVNDDINTIDNSINDDIDNLLNNRFDKLYLSDRYKFHSSNINIVYPKIPYPQHTPLLYNSDKVRYLLSFYPDKETFSFLKRIVLRPKYIEVSNTELVALYLRNKKTLVMYLTQPHMYYMDMKRFKHTSEFILLDMEKMAQNKLHGEKISLEDKKEMLIHPLWYILNNLKLGDQEKIDKFFMKKNLVDTKTYQMLNDISFFYSRHGY